MTHHRPFRLGVLGGIGPEATGVFYLHLIKRLQEENLIRHNEDFPQIIINSIPAPELVFDTFKEKDVQPYLQGLKELEAMKPDCIIMVCNTIHLFHEQFQAELKTPILNLKEEVAQELRRRNASAVAVLGTPQTVRCGLYEITGIRPIRLTDEECVVIGAAVFNFNRGFEIAQSKAVVTEIAQAQLQKGAALLVLGCTELAVMLEGSPLPTLDTMDVLVDAVIKRYKEHKR